MTYLTDIISYQVDGVTIVEGVGTNSMCVPRFFSLGKQEEAPSEHLTICAAKVDSERERETDCCTSLLFYIILQWQLLPFPQKKKRRREIAMLKIQKKDCQVSQSLTKWQQKD
jgi:hypothetical protein